MKLYNPTEDVIEERFNGFPVIVGPGEEKSVSDDCGLHMMMKRGCYGLISLEYGENEEKEYGSFTNFKKIMRNSGLKTYKEWLQQCLQQEQLFPREVSQKNGGEVELSNTKVPYFKNKLKEIDSLIERNIKEETQEIKTEEKVEAVPVVKKAKKRGRPRKVKHVDKSGTTSEGQVVS